MKTTRSLSFLLLCTLCCVFLFSCGKKTARTENTELKEKTIITASFYPLYIMLMNITGGIPDIQLSLLAPADTGCLHDYQMTTKDMNAIEKADILVVNGAGMESFMEKALETKADAVIIASEGARLVEEGGHAHEDGTEHGGDVNPHVWVSVPGAIHETERITEGLAALDPEHAGQYRKNGEAYVQRLRGLESRMHKALDPYRGNTIVTFHEAFPYFAEDFGFRIAAVIEREPGTAPSAKELLKVIDTIRRVQEENGRIALFAEPQYSSSAAGIIASETGLTVYELDPAVTGPLDADAYIDAMDRNTETLIRAFSDSPAMKAAS